MLGKQLLSEEMNHKPSNLAQHKNGDDMREGDKKTRSEFLGTYCCCLSMECII